MKTIRMAAAAALVAMVAGGGMLAITAPAGAVVYCRTVGVPHGCVARPGAVVVHPAPVVRGPVVYCKRVGYPKGCVMR